uniref:WD repeat-containing protein 11 n=2 Tax=Cacopsylla melanoneura TaxID=428564 RepID=A0A8D8RS64_9HEMI
MAVTGHPPLMPSLSQLSLGVTRTSRDVMSETLLSGDTDLEHRGSMANQIQLVTPRIIPGPCHLNNKGCIDWGPQGLIAYGANLSVAVVDPVTCQPIQCFLKHKAVVKKVIWCPQEFGSLRLVSADMCGTLILWNVETGTSDVVVQDDKKPILGMAWTSQSHTYRSSSSLLPPLAALHSPYSLVIWDMNKGVRLWRKVFTDTLLSFDIDPFDSTRLAFQCPDCILFIDDFSVSRIPSSNGRKFYISSPRMSEPDEGVKSKDRLKRLMRGLTVGEMKPRTEDSMTLSDCLQLSYHRSLRHHVLLLYARDVLIIDLHINMSVGVIPIERTASPLTQVISCRQRDVLYCLHESGSVSVKVRRQFLSHSNTQDVPGTPLPSDEGREGSEAGGGDLCVWYEARTQGEVTRQSKGLKVMGLTLCPVTENTVGLLLNSGKVVLFTLDLNQSSDNVKPRHLYTLSDLVPPSTVEKGPGPPLRLLATGLIQSGSIQIKTISMCPALNSRNILHYVPLLGAGTATGQVYLFNVGTGLLEKQFNVHTGPVMGIEWVNSHSFLSYSYTLLSTSTTSSLARNELVITDIHVGHSVSIRKSALDEPYIDILKVSPLCQYFILILKDGPFELWDLRKCQLLRVMPKRIPLVTALAWSTSGSGRGSRKGKSVNKSQAQSVLVEAGEEVEKDHLLSKEDTTAADRKRDRKQSEELVYNRQQDEVQDIQTPGGCPEDYLLPVKERLVFTDTDSQLYYFIVEGNTLKDGIRIPPEESARRVNYLAIKCNHIVQAHMDGMLHIWDLKAKKSRVKDLGRRWIRKIQFAPGKDNLRLLVLTGDGVDMIDLSEPKSPGGPEVQFTLKTPRDIVKVLDIDWASSDHPVLLTEDGSLLILDKSLTVSTSPLVRYSMAEHVELFCLLNKHNYDGLLLHLCAPQLYRTVPLDAILGNMSTAHLQDKLSQLGLDEQLLNSMDLVDRYILVASVLKEVKLVNLMILFKYYTSVHVRQHNLEYSGGATEYLHLSNKRLNPHPSIPPLETCYDVLLDPYHYQKLELERTALHESKRGDYKHTQYVIQRLILLGETDRAVQLLLETNISNDNYYSDAIKACLVSTIRSTSAAQSTIKLVATNLIANERVWEGVQLLCLISKGLDACKYLTSYGQWQDAVWLAKSILSETESVDVLKKWCHHLTTLGDWYSALLAYISIGHFESAVEILLDKQEPVLGWLLVNSCDEYDIQIDRQVKERLKRALRETFECCDTDLVSLLFSI